ncbi:DASH family cryptochrome [Saprospiraceae bacterium]|jgi:deoxyribodipyrimidine photo-lyase|nr:DASH family cryptochrome [Saprospiraceae bacterium]
MKRGLFWFRNDLRLADNYALSEAVKECDEIVPVYILEEKWLGQDRWGFTRTEQFRLKFLLESIQDLKSHLSEKGSDLIFDRGNSIQLIKELAKKYECDSIFASKEYTPEEIKIEEEISKVFDLNLYHNSTLFHPKDVPFSIEKTPDIFTSFRKKAEKFSKVREVIPSPIKIKSPKFQNLQNPDFEELIFSNKIEDKRAVLQFKGGATEAWKRLDHYFWKSKCLSKYKETRNGLVGTDYSSKFSPWLANGSISPRQIYDEVLKYEDEIEKNQSTYWMIFELLWRDYFKFMAMKYGSKIFFKGGIQNRNILFRNNPKNFQKWATGTTSDPFVDANMRELLNTGWMSNRGRQNVGSYLVHQLKEDWRKGAAWFESLLIDYDPTSNYGNWMYVAGVGNDPRDRVFNMKTQAKRYDPNGDFQKLWLGSRK